jgi:predicted  nucleic acid-binding Zn-ribbon protein
METTVEQKLISLFNLQLIDSKIDKIHNIRGELPVEVSDLEDEVTGLSTRVDKLTQEVQHFKHSIDDRKNFIKESNSNIIKYEGQQNNVKNNREFLALSKEIELQKLEIMAAEKKIKEYQFNLEDRKSQIEYTKAQIDERKKDLTIKKEELSNIVADTQKEEDFLMSLRGNAEVIIDDRYKNAYTRIRAGVKNKLAVVSVERNACAGCFSKLPPQRQLDMRQRKKIIVCENCGRILIDHELAEETKIEIENKVAVLH